MPTTTRSLLRLIWQHPANRDHRWVAVVKAALWQAYKRTIKRPFNLPVYEGMRLRAYSDSHEPGRFIYYGGLPDYDEMMFMKRYLRPGDRFIDAGANEGIYTLLAASLVGKGGRVDAFEPAPVEALRLKENVARNELSQVEVHEAALADAVGHAEFTIARGSGNRLRRIDDDFASKPTPVTSVDTALPAIGYAMAKLDVEGAELLVLRGAARHLSAHSPPVLLLELVDSFLRRFGSSAFEVAEWLESRGYELATYDPRANRLYIRGRRLAGSTTNVFAVSRCRMPFVASRLGTDGSMGNSVRRYRRTA
jgi:FkbM family methyltransferase